MRRIVNKNDDRTLFLVEFPVHQVFAETGKLKDVIGITPQVARLFEGMSGNHSRQELQKIFDLKDVEHFRKAYLLPAIEAGFVEMTLPDKPKSRLQKYRLTENGKTLKNLLKDEPG